MSQNCHTFVTCYDAGPSEPRGRGEIASPSPPDSYQGHIMPIKLLLSNTYRNILDDSYYLVCKIFPGFSALGVQIEKSNAVCTPRAGNPGNVLLTSRNPIRYFYQWLYPLDFQGFPRPCEKIQALLQWPTSLYLNSEISTQHNISSFVFLSSFLSWFFFTFFQKNAKFVLD